MRRIVYITAALILLAVCGDTSEAGPIRDRIAARREARAERWQQYTPQAQGAFAPGCICGDNCACAPGVCPAKCPVTMPQFVYPQYQLGAANCSSCQGGSCPAPQRGFFRR